MRSMLKQYIGCEMEVLVEAVDFRDLLEENRELLNDFCSMVGQESNNLRTIEAWKDYEKGDVLSHSYHRSCSLFYSYCNKLALFHAFSITTRTSLVTLSTFLIIPKP
jgi:hypothetical protein